jgi:hypothetical protein
VPQALLPQSPHQFPIIPFTQSIGILAVGDFGM